MGIQINGQTDTISATDGSFTISGASGNLTGNLTGNVTGNVTGNLTGTASTATAAATAYGISGSPTLSGITSVSTTNLTVNGNAYPSTGPLSNRNKIINGDMRIDQRNAGSSVTPTADTEYTLDRYQARLTQSSKYSVQRSTTAPEGFTNSLLVTSLSDYSVTSTDRFAIGQIIEGFNVADLGSGTANAKTVTLSFWVRSSLTGTFGGSLAGAAGVNQFYVFSYSISSANTWEYKTITIPGSTSGSWETGNGAGLNVRFGLGAGTSTSGTAGSWGTTNFWQPTGSVSVVGTNGATFYITGVQLEVGSVATPFEYRSYGDELARCQRYFCKNGSDCFVTLVAQSASDNITKSNSTEFPVTMRAQPGTITLYDIVGTSGQVHYQPRGGPGSNIAGSIYESSTTHFAVRKTAAANEEAQIIFRYEASAEL